jgi:hypothetical protein
MKSLAAHVHGLTESTMPQFGVVRAVESTRPDDVSSSTVVVVVNRHRTRSREPTDAVASPISPDPITRAIDAAVTGIENRQLSDTVGAVPKFVVAPNVISRRQNTMSADCAYRAVIVASPNDGVAEPVAVVHVGVQSAHTGEIDASRSAVICSPASHC